MLFDDIRNESSLQQYIKSKCSDSGMEVKVNQNIASSNLLIIKLDEFYNNQHLNPTPPSPDCLILQKCNGGRYKLTIIEFKNINKSSGYTVDNIIGKFATCFDDFILQRYKNFFNLAYKDIDLYFITRISQRHYDVGLKSEALIERPIKFNGHKLLINANPPTTEIVPC